MYIYKKKESSYHDYFQSESGQRRGLRKLTVKEVLTFPIMGNPDRQLTQEAAEYFQIRQELSQEDGKTIVATCYPSFNTKGDITGFKRRDWTIDKEERFHFTTIGTVKAKHQMFGQPQAACGLNRKTLIQTEDEEDTYCVWQACLDNLRDEVKALGNRTDDKAAGLRNYLQNIEYSRQEISKGVTDGKFVTFSVVGLNVGAPNAVETVSHAEKFIKRYDKYVLCLDNDKLTEEERVKYSNACRGEEAAENIASYLLTDNIYKVQYPHAVNDPDGYKDPRDFVAAGDSKVLAKLTWYCDAKYAPEKILSVSDMSVDRLRKKKKDGVYFPYFRGLNRMHITPVRGELWVVTGPSGAGKSTVSRCMEHSIINYLRYGLLDGTYNPETINYDKDGLPRLPDYEPGERCGIIRLEEDEEETINAHLAMDLKIDPKEFAEEPASYLTREEHEKILKKWKDEDKIKVLDHFGSIPLDQLISKLKQLVFMNNCKWIVLDHLSMLVSGLRTADERKELDIIMTELAAFCKNYNVFILAVAHLKRVPFEPPRDKDTGEQKAFFYPVRKEHLRGSAALEQLSWVVIGVEPEELPNRSRGRIRLVSLKNRRGKKLGIADTLFMMDDGTYVNAKNWTIEGDCYMLGDKMMYQFEPEDDFENEEESDTSDEHRAFDLYTDIANKQDEAKSLVIDDADTAEKSLTDVTFDDTLPFD